MKNPAQSAYTRIIHSFTHIARYKGLPELRAYVATAAFRADMNALDDARYIRALAAHAKAQAKCSSKIPPLPRGGTAKRVNWRDPATVDRFRAVCAKAGSDDVAARIFGISKSAARMARLRYLEAPTTGPYALAA